MTFAVLAPLFSALLDFLSLFARSEREKDLEILLLRQQLRILQRTRSHPPRLSWWEKVPLAMLAGKMVQKATNSRARLSQSLLLFTPETVLRWHRELVRQKLDLPPSASRRQTAHCWGAGSTDRSNGSREPALGIQQNRRRAAQARLPRWALDHSRSAQAPAYRLSRPRVLDKAAPGVRAFANTRSTY